MEPTPPPVCLNCGTPVTGPFCTECAQEHAYATRLTLGITFHDIIDGFVQVNRSLARAAVDLVLRPGLLTADYLAGRRMRHPAPAKLYLVVNFVYFIVFQWFEPVTVEVVAQVIGEEYYAQAQAASQLDPDEFGRAVVERLNNVITSILVLFVPFIALALRGLYARRRLNVVGHAVFGFHLMAFLLLVRMPGDVAAEPLGQFLTDASVLVGLPLWAGIALHRVYGGKWGWTLLRTAALWLVVMFLLALYVYGLGYYALYSVG